MKSEEWSNKEMIKRVLKKDGAGPFLYYENGNIYVSDGEGHCMWLGVSGSGKSRRGLVIYAMTVVLALQSGIFVDPKGEIWEIIKDQISDLYDVHILNFRKLYEADAEGWNPLSAPYQLWITGKPQNIHASDQIIEDLAHTMFPEAKGADPFWINEARALFIGVVKALFKYARPEQINLASCYYLISDGEERDGSTTYLKEFVKLLEHDEDVSMQLKSFVSTASDTAGGIRSVYLDGLSQYARSYYIREFLSHDELCINKLRGDKPTIIDIILPDETDIYDKIVAAMCSQLMNHYIRIAEQEYNGKLPIRVNILLDELGNIGGSMKNTLPHLLTAGRSRNLRVGLVLQSLSQLNQIFDSNNAQTIIGNCDVRVCYRVNDFETLSELSRLCGDKEIKYDGHISREPLITPSQLAAMETGQALVMVSGRVKFITWLPDFTELPISYYRPERKASVNRRKRSKYSYFDIQGFVNDKKSERMQMGKDLNSFAFNHYPNDFMLGDLSKSEDPHVRNEETNNTLDTTLEDIIARIDEEIKIREQEEAEAISKQNSNEEEIQVLITCDANITDKIAKHVAKKCNVSYKEGKKILESDCLLSVVFSSYEEAHKFVDEINDLGGSAWIQGYN